MSPVDGFQVIQHIQAEQKGTLSVLLSNNPSTDLLYEAGKYQISQLLQKPVSYDRLNKTIARLTKILGKAKPDYEPGDQVYNPEDLMNRAIALAHQNARSGMGGPFGAVVANKDGKILGEGTNGVRSRSDPIAHAEVVAIREATKAIQDVRLDGCIIYCSSEPTMLGLALIIGTGINKIFYGLSLEEVGSVREENKEIIDEISKPMGERCITYEQLQHDEACEMFEKCQSMKS